MTIEQVFVTKIYRGMLRGSGTRRLNQDLHRAVDVLASDDVAGQNWSRENGYAGYTSYASLNDLPWRGPEFAELKTHLDHHVTEFVTTLDFDLSGGVLTLDSLWVNVLEPGGSHQAHIHPHSVISGTYYVTMPVGAGAIRFEDPRQMFMMAAPPRKSRASQENRPYVVVQPKTGNGTLVGKVGCDTMCQEMTAKRREYPSASITAGRATKNLSA